MSKIQSRIVWKIEPWKQVNLGQNVNSLRMFKEVSKSGGFGPVGPWHDPDPKILQVIEVSLVYTKSGKGEEKKSGKSE